jgi:hypothetical protein
MTAGKQHSKKRTGGLALQKVLRLLSWYANKGVRHMLARHLLLFVTCQCCHVDDKLGVLYFSQEHARCIGRTAGVAQTLLSGRSPCEYETNLHIFVVNNPQNENVANIQS